MKILLDSAIALFAAIGIFTVLWMLWGIFKGPFSRYKDNEIYTLIKIKGSEPELEYIVDKFKWLGGATGKNLNITIADAGMDEETREIARRICEEQGIKICCDAELPGNTRQTNAR